jgi:hypothetical protein
MDEEAVVLFFFVMGAVYVASSIYVSCGTVGIAIVFYAPFSLLCALIISIFLDAIHTSKLNPVISVALSFGIPLTYAFNSCIISSNSHNTSPLLLLISSIVLFLFILFSFDALYHYTPYHSLTN